MSFFKNLAATQRAPSDRLRITEDKTRLEILGPPIWDNAANKGHILVGTEGQLRVWYFTVQVFKKLQAINAATDNGLDNNTIDLIVYRDTPGAVPRIYVEAATKES